MEQYLAERASARVSRLRQRERQLEGTTYCPFPRESVVSRAFMGYLWDMAPAVPSRSSVTLGGPASAGSHPL